MAEYTPSINIPDEVVGLMAAAIKATVRNFPGHVSDRMADQIARSALHAMTPWLSARDESVRAEERGYMVRDIEDAMDDDGDGTPHLWFRGMQDAARIAREGAGA